MSRKVFVVSESRPKPSAAAARKQTGERPRGWTLEISLLALFIVALALWLHEDDEAKPAASSHVQTRPAASFEALEPDIAADPFGARDWGSTAPAPTR